MSAGAVVGHDGCALLIRRVAPEGVLVWQVPAGKVDRGESPLDAGAREVCEEAGMVVEPLSVIGTRLDPASLREVAEVAWVSIPIPRTLPVASLPTTTKTPPVTDRNSSWLQ